ncbi:MAG TPA: hypothetical protein VLK65_17480 [Vicinamibacteria bacterium]|nr:hypothetical protein [Vicinamibacteria bacterium]
MVWMESPGRRLRILRPWMERIGRIQLRDKRGTVNLTVKTHEGVGPQALTGCRALLDALDEAGVPPPLSGELSTAVLD